MDILFQNFCKKMIPNENGEKRKIGIEIEYSNLPIDKSAAIIQDLFGGEIKERS